jgi:tetratricopeptide (TPR) repeat protein
MDSMPGCIQTFGEGSEFEDAHFIECKFYSRPIELDVVAKTVLASIRFQPKSTTLATRTNLTPQAEEYIRFFVGNKFIRTQAFRVWEPLKDSTSTHLRRKIKSVESFDSICKTFSLKDVSLQIEYLFSKVYVHPREERLSLTSLPLSLRLKGVVAPPSNKQDKRLDKASLAVVAPEEDTIHCPVKVERAEKNGDWIIEARIDGARFLPGITYSSWVLSFESGKQSLDRLSISSFPPISLNKFHPALPDFREDETLSAYEYWEESGIPITLVSGESGVGKSYLCEQLCLYATENGYSAVQTNFNSDNKTAFIASFAWAVIDPDMQNILSANGDSLEDFVESWCLASNFNRLKEHEVDALKSLMTKGSLKDVASEALLETIARMIVNRGVPILFYAQELHNASAIVSECLWKLIQGFSAAGWGRVKVILERQETSTKQNQALWDNLHRDFIDVLWDCDAVEPLTEKRMVAVLASVLACHERVMVATMIVAKSGHDLQHLNIIVKTLQQKGLLEMEGIVHGGKSDYRYTVSSLSEMKDCLDSLPGARLDASIELIDLVDKGLRKQGDEFGCRWLGLLAIIKFSPDIDLLSGLTGLSCLQIEEELEVLVDKELIVLREGGYAFEHESLIEAAKTWFESLPSIKTWLRKNAVRPCTPTRFEEGLARGRLWRYLSRPEQAFGALNSAIGLAPDDFVARIQCHMEMHDLLVESQRHERHREFFENMKAIGWYGHYALPVEKQIVLNDEAISFHGGLSPLDLPEPLYSQTLSNLHRLNAWLHIQQLDQKRYYLSSEAALESTTDIHEIAMMLNRYILMCRHWGMYEPGIEAVLASIVLCEEVDPRKDKDLLSVNYSMSAPLVAESEAEIDGRLAFLEEACANPHATRRELAHNKLALADTYTIRSDFSKAHEAIGFAQEVMHEQSMESLGISYYQSLGLWHGAQEQWRMACGAFSRSLSKASWLGQRLEALKAGQNLLIAYVKAEDFAQARELFHIVLKQCLEGMSIPDVSAARSLLSNMLCKGRDLLVPEIGDSIEERMAQKAQKYGIMYPPRRQYSGSVFYSVLGNAKALCAAYPQHFAVSDTVEDLLGGEQHAELRQYRQNCMHCPSKRAHSPELYFYM